MKLTSYEQVRATGHAARAAANSAVQGALWRSAVARTQPHPCLMDDLGSNNTNNASMYATKWKR